MQTKLIKCPVSIFIRGMLIVINTTKLPLIVLKIQINRAANTDLKLLAGEDAIVISSSVNR
jgi:hypothetical protein